MKIRDVQIYSFNPINITPIQKSLASPMQLDEFSSAEVKGMPEGKGDAEGKDEE